MLQQGSLWVVVFAYFEDLLVAVLNFDLACFSLPLVNYVLRSFTFLYEQATAEGFTGLA